MSPAPDSRIDAYIADAAPFARPILQHLRVLVQEACPGAAETMKWSMPHFEYAGKILCGMAAFKAHCTFGFWHQDMENVVAARPQNAGAAMGTFGRITSLEDLPNDATLRRYIRAAAKLNESAAPGRPRPVSASRKPLPVPAELAAALKKNRAAAQTFEKFSPSRRKEYIEWITGAKRDETRQKRLATTLEWLAAGKPRHWKYVNC